MDEPALLSAMPDTSSREILPDPNLLAFQPNGHRASAPKAMLKELEDANQLKAHSTAWKSALAAESRHVKQGCYSQTITDQHQITLAELRHQHQIQLSEAKDQLSRRMIQHQSDLTELSDNMIQTLSTLNVQHQGELSEVRAQLQAAHTDKLSIATELDSLLSEHESLMTKEEHTHADFTQLQQQHQQLMNWDKQQQLQLQLASEANQYNLACLQAAIQHKAELDHKLITVTEAHSQAAQHTASLSHELCSLRKDFATANSELKDLRTQLQHAEEALERELKAHEQTTCAAQRTEAQLTDLGDVYRQQAQAQADAKADMLYLLHNDAQHDLFTDFQCMEQQLVALQAKCRHQRQQIKDGTETQKGLTAALDKATAENTQSWRLNKADIVSRQRQVLYLQEQLVFAQKHTVSAQEQMVSAQERAASAQEQLSVRDEEHRRTSDSQQADKAALTMDLHRLEDEILRLEQLLQVTQQARLQQQQQHEPQMLEGHASSADLLRQLNQAHSRVDQLVSRSCEDHAVHTESIGSLTFRLGEAEDKLSLAHQQHQQKLQQKLQHQSDQSSRAEEELEGKFQESDSKLSELKAEQDSLHAHLGRLRQLAIKNQITPEAIFSMFADPVAPAVAGDGIIADASATTAVNPPLPSATTAGAPDGNLAATVSTPQATASSPPAAASTIPATASILPEPAVPYTGKSITAPAATAVAAVSAIVAAASRPVPTAGQNQAVTTMDSAGLGSDVASVHGSVLRLPAAEPTILLDCGSDLRTDIMKRSEELQGALAKGAAAEGGFFLQGEEEDDSKHRAAHLQRGMFMHPNLTLAAALEIGAAAYAESVQDCSFSTQEVIDSMLEHDKSFQGLLAEASTDFEIDIWELRFAVVDAYRYIKEYEEIMISKGKEKQRWATEAPRNPVIWSSGAAGGIAGLEDTRSIHMVIPGAWNSKQNVALQLLYTYWGIPLRNEMYSW